MWDRVVDDPRLSYWGRDVGDHPDLAAMRHALERHYGRRLRPPGLNHYRDGSDSVAWHADREPAPPRRHARRHRHARHAAAVPRPPERGRTVDRPRPGLGRSARDGRRVPTRLGAHGAQDGASRPPGLGVVALGGGRATGPVASADPPAKERACPWPTTSTTPTATSTDRPTRSSRSCAASSPSPGRRCPDEPGYWAVLTHADVVARRPRPGDRSRPRTAASCSRTSPPEQLAMMRNMLLAMDPPRHVDYRRTAAPAASRPGHRRAGGPDPLDLPRDHGDDAGRRATSSSCTTSPPSCRRRWSASSWASPEEDWAEIHRWAEHEHERPGPRARRPTATRATPRRRHGRDGDVRDRVRRATPRRSRHARTSPR